MRSLDLVYAAVDQINDQNPDGSQIKKDPATPLLDAAGGIDSLTLVNIVVAIEQLVYDETGNTISIADESVFSSPSSPFRTLGSLAAHLETVLS